MGHEVFISYSSQDKLPADAACAVLESKGIRCWMAPRDILPGEDWGQAIIAALNGCKVMVLIFSGHANQSQQVKREVDRAIHHGVLLIPMRIEDVLPASSLEYFLSTPHWLDAFAPPLERHLLQLAATIKQVLNRPQDAPSPQPLRSPPRSLWGRPLTWIAAAAAAIVVGACIIWAVFAWRPANVDNKANPSQADGPSRDGGTPDDSTTDTGEKTEEFEYMMEGQSKKGTRRVRTLDLGGGVTMELVRIPHGKFMMGSTDSDEDVYDDEKPQHAVTIAKDFYLGKYLVTKKQFARFVAAQGASYQTEGEAGDGGSGFDGTDFKQDKKYSWRNTGFAQTDDHPVVNVTWNDAAEFCEWAGPATRRGVALPTEAQWEYACRGGTSTRYFTGDGAESLEGSANIADQSAKKQFSKWTVADFDDGYVFTSPVGKFRPNQFGLYDMMGNVYEWRSDYYDPKYYTNSDKSDPANLIKSDARVMRGGSFGEGTRGCHAGCRYSFAPASRDVFSGFRVRVRLD